MTATPSPIPNFIDHDLFVLTWRPCVPNFSLISHVKQQILAAGHFDPPPATVLSEKPSRSRVKNYIILKCSLIPTPCEKMSKNEQKLAKLAPLQNSSSIILCDFVLSLLPVFFLTLLRLGFSKSTVAGGGVKVTRG